MIIIQLDYSYCIVMFGRVWSACCVHSNNAVYTVLLIDSFPISCKRCYYYIVFNLIILKPYDLIWRNSTTLVKLTVHI